MRRLAITLLVIVSSGCSFMGSRETPKAAYDFGPLPARISQTHNVIDVDLVVEEIRAPTWLDTPSMYYRLIYKNSAVPMPYADSEWVTSPAALLTQRLRSSIAGPSGAQAAQAPVEPASSPVLRAELLQFEQVFDGPGNSRGEVRLRATLERKGQVERRTFVINEPAPTPDAAGGARALSLCSDELVAQIGQWVSTS